MKSLVKFLTILFPGLISDSPNLPNFALNYITLPIADNSYCRTIYRPDLITADHVCLQSVNRGSACRG